MLALLKDSVSIVIRLDKEEGDDKYIKNLEKLTSKDSILLKTKITHVYCNYRDDTTDIAEIMISSPYQTGGDEEGKDRPIWLAVGLKFLLIKEIITKEFMYSALSDFMETNNDTVENFLGSPEVMEALKDI